MVQPDVAPRPYVDEGSETIRLPTAADGTVQLLPGMLVMTVGPEVGKEFRFLRVAGQVVPELTIGRASGPQYRHIQLPAATVSRMHARIRFEGGAWRIANLSATNPARVNGRELPSMEEIVLVDGDRIELGEVELSYRNGNP
jgi:pSer/pThr/pTyr-binding forkhead associated (FHA) protein